jgi:hypothetical protein
MFQLGIPQSAACLMAQFTPMHDKPAAIALFYRALHDANSHAGFACSGRCNKDRAPMPLD